VIHARIRDRRPSDLADCVSALRAVHETDGYPMNWPEDPIAWLSPADGLQAWVAVTDDGGVAGHVMLQSTSTASVSAVARLFVAPRARGCGLGARLLDHVRQWAAERGIDLVLEVTAGERSSAIALYERTGWRRTGTEQASWTAPSGEPVLLYRYALPPSAADSEQLAGGVNAVVRMGRRVHRPAGEWTPAVHALLKHLESKGFTAAPRVHGFDAEGREVLDFISGEVPGARVHVTDEALAEVAVMLRAFHDATGDFSPPPAAAWQFPPRTPAEVICHGDVAPYNTVFRDGRPVALIDFDTAHPAPRIWDVAYAAYRFVQLVEDGVPPAEQARRLALFADAYGLSAADREALIDTAIARLHHLVAFMRRQAAAGHPAFSRHVAEGHDGYYLRNVEHIGEHRARFEAAQNPEPNRPAWH
jgi:Ser/Thr protein kinase RdoA (MazF antagonist)/GNAT superfamily N-acetyltransferase